MSTTTDTKSLPTFTHNPTGWKEVTYEILPSGTAFHIETAEPVRRILETYRGSDTRLRVHYGDVESGLDWMDTYDVEGSIGRSMGRLRVPLLVNNRRSMGGGAILDHCIVRIRFANRAIGGDLFRHPDYHVNEDTLASWPDRDKMFPRHFA